MGDFNNASFGLQLALQTPFKTKIIIRGCIFEHAK